MHSHSQTHSQTNKEILVIQSCLKSGQDREGVDEAPMFFINNHLPRALVQSSTPHPPSQVNYTVETIREDQAELCSERDTGPTSPSALRQKLSIVASFNQSLHKTIVQRLSSTTNSGNAQPFLLNVGGDHSVAIGSISALLSINKGKMGVVWVDAHADINTMERSVSKKLHGCPVAFLLGTEDCTALGGFEWLAQSPRLPPSSIAYVGLRDLDEWEKEFLGQSGICYFTMDDVEALGIGEVVSRALKSIDPDGNLPLHLSLDVDGLDPLYTPSTGTPVIGGLTYREARVIASRLESTGRLRSMDLVELNCRIGDQRDVDRTFQCASEIVDICLGTRYI